MKKFLVVIVLAAMSISAFAQDKSNRDANGAIVRGPYETNAAFDNMFIGVAGGVNLYSETGAYDSSWGDRFTLALDAYVGKWFTPSIGARIGYQGFTAKSFWAENKAMDYKYGNLHADFMWNISNAIGGYRSDRFWSFVPYVGAGWGHLKGDDVEFKNNSFVGTAGLMNLVRLGNRVNLTLDARLTAADSNFGLMNGGDRKGDYMGTVTAGLQVNIGKVGFERAQKINVADYTDPLNAQIASLQNQNKSLADQNAKLQNEINALKNRPAPQPVVKTSYVVAPLSVFFEIGSAKISQQYGANIDAIAKVIKESDSNYIIKGYADSATGTAKINQKLSEQRAEAVKEALIKAGVSASKLEAKGFGGVDTNKTPLMNRIAVIEAK